MTSVSVSLSGGKDSTAMLLMMLERGEQVDEVVFFDTGMEFPEMHDHLRRLESDTGVAFTRLRMEPPFRHWMFEHEMSRGKMMGSRGYGWPKPNARWCTRLKTTAIEQHLKGRDGVIQCVGIAADELGRVRDKRYPLVEWGVTEADALAYCYSMGYDWGGLYEHFPRVSCWCCPLKSIDDCRMLRKHHPELWDELMRMDSEAWNDFRSDYTAAQLEERFGAEDKQGRLL